jgi:hypothetical protein
MEFWVVILSIAPVFLFFCTKTLNQLDKLLTKEIIYLRYSFGND